MGERANYVVIEEGEWELYYSHWGGISVTRNLFFGPGASVEWLREHRRIEQGDWLDTLWCSGGASIDMDEKRLVVFDGGKASPTQTV